jgi:hypothetical protein
MKKTIVILTVLLFSIPIIAQNANDSILLSKKGSPVLPQKGDWALGVDAVPYITFMGNLFYNTSANPTNLSKQTIYARYFISDKAALRILAGINHTTSYQREYVQDDAGVFTNPLSRAQTQDNIRHDNGNYTIDLGLQFFKGAGRLRGFYGLHAGYSLNLSNDRYTYGNPISAANTMPSSMTTFKADGSRLLEQNRGMVQVISAGLIAGAEYYFLPKICVGAEITLSAACSLKSQGHSKYERWNGNIVENYNMADDPEGLSGISIFSQSPANYSAGLYVMFHF